MKALFADKKKAFLSHEVAPVRMPNWPELKIKTIIEIVKNDAEVAKYFKDEYWLLEKPHSKPFMCNVINSLYPGLLQGLVTESNGLRNSVEGEEKQKDAIMMTDKWRAMLDSSPYTSS